MWYGYVGPGGEHCVSESWKTIEGMAALLPYSKYRKFKTEEDAWKFVYRNSKKKKLTNIIRYGNMFKSHYLTVNYYILPDCVCYNIDTRKLGRITLESVDPNVIIENRTENINVKLKEIRLNDDLIISHAIAIYQILDILGPYVDVEFIIPDHSIFYLFTAYSGEKSSYVRILSSIKQRKGEISLTLKDW